MLLVIYIIVGIFILVGLSLSLTSTTNLSTEKPVIEKPIAREPKMSNIIRIENQDSLQAETIEQLIAQTMQHMSQLMHQGVPSPFWKGKWELERARNITATMQETFNQLLVEYNKLCSLMDMQKGLPVGTTAQMKASKFIHKEEMAMQDDKYRAEEEHTRRMGQIELELKKQEGLDLLEIAEEFKKRGLQ